MLRRIKHGLLGARDRVRLTGRHYEHARKLLLFTVDLLNDSSINYHVVYGTLLGLARDGDLIPWDIDVDLMVSHSDVSRLRRLLWKHRLCGWRVCDRYGMAHDTTAWRRGDVSSIMIRRPLLADVFQPPYFRTGRKIMDIYVRYPDGDCQAWETFGRMSRAPRHFFAGYETLEYAGRSVHVPRYHQDFLKLVFGDWRTPNLNYDAHREDGTLTFGQQRPVADSTQWKKAA